MTFADFGSSVPFGAYLKELKKQCFGSGSAWIRIGLVLLDTYPVSLLGMWIQIQEQGNISKLINFQPFRMTFVPT
jgi:hypothetical protein